MRVDVSMAKRFGISGDFMSPILGFGHITSFARWHLDEAQRRF